MSRTAGSTEVSPPGTARHSAAPRHGTGSPLTALKPLRKSTGSSSALVRRALSSTGAMTLLHRLRCSWMISLMLPKSRSASTCGVGGELHKARHHGLGPNPMHPCHVLPSPRPPAVIPDPAHPHPAAVPLTSHSSPDSCRFSRQQRKSCGDRAGARWGRAAAAQGTSPAGSRGTHVGDDFELADVGGLGVQQLPDGFLLVALPARQGLRG